MKKFLALIGLFLLAGCGEVPLHLQQDVVSQTETYRLSVPREKAEDGFTYHFVTISSVEGVEEYKDVDKDFVGNLRVYWAWDAADRVWLYSSDTGQVYVWIKEEGNWNKYLWGHGRNDRVYKESIQPPPELFPDYYEHKK